MGLYKFYCEYCSFTKITDGNDLGDLVEFKRSPIQKTIPKWDNEKKKTIPGSNYDLPKRFKCPKCGRLIRPQKLKTTTNEENNDTRSQERNEGY